jgi:hypothetical protein
MQSCDVLQALDKAFDTSTDICKALKDTQFDQQILNKVRAGARAWEWGLGDCQPVALVHGSCSSGTPAQHAQAHHWAAGPCFLLRPSPAWPHSGPSGPADSSANLWQVYQLVFSCPAAGRPAPSQQYTLTVLQLDNTPPPLRVRTSPAGHSRASVP